ncbi:hypothetical protein LJR084_002455 [Variovorax sp. LjRoot84]
MNENEMNLYIAHYIDPAAEEGYQLLIDEPTTFSRFAWLSISIGQEHSRVASARRFSCKPGVGVLKKIVDLIRISALPAMLLIPNHS